MNEIDIQAAKVIADTINREAAAGKSVTAWLKGGRSIKDAESAAMGDVTVTIDAGHLSWQVRADQLIGTFSQ